MANPVLRSVGNFLPYSDGSGYRATVTVEQISPTDNVTITIDAIFRIDAAEWPEVVNGVATMLKSFSSTPNREDAGA